MLWGKFSVWVYFYLLLVVYRLFPLVADRLIPLVVVRPSALFAVRELFSVVRSSSQCNEVNSFLSWGTKSFLGVDLPTDVGQVVAIGVACHCSL